MKTYNIGIIGYGGFGKFLHHWWSKLDAVTVVALSDQSFDNGESGNLKYYSRWEDLISNEEIDIISIATPPSLHVEIACEAMRKNKHVLLEKPIALTKEGAEEILRTQQETGMTTTVDHMLRYNPIIKALIHLSQNEVFGKLRHVSVNNYAQDEGLPMQHWFWDKDISGGIFVEHGVHFFDIVNALTSQKVIKVTGCAHNRNDRQQDQVSATVLYDAGLIATHYHSFSGPGFFEQTTIRLNYDLARIEIEGWMPMKGSIEALINKDNRDKLNLIPHLKIEKIIPIEYLSDVSRPEGWGVSQEEEENNIIHCGGIIYNVTEMISATFEIPYTKSEVYGSCLQNILSDLITKIEDRSHKLNVTLDDAYEGLKVALLAKESANENY